MACDIQTGQTTMYYTNQSHRNYNCYISKYLDANCSLAQQLSLFVIRKVS